MDRRNSAVVSERAESFRPFPLRPKPPFAPPVARHPKIGSFHAADPLPLRSKPSFRAADPFRLQPEALDGTEDPFPLQPEPLNGTDDPFPPEPEALFRSEDPFPLPRKWVFRHFRVLNLSITLPFLPKSVISPKNTQIVPNSPHLHPLPKSKI